LRHPAGGAVGHNRALLLAQDMIEAERERILLADVGALLVNNGQPISVGILAKTDHRFGVNDLLAHCRQVLGGRLRSMFKLAVCLAAEQSNVAAEHAEQSLTKHASRTGVAVEEHAKLPLANRLYIDSGLNKTQM